METRPIPVPSVAKQVGDASGVRAWAEPAVWTDCMLEALERGVQGGVWYSLIDKVYRLANLNAALAKVAANKGAAGVDHVTIREFLLKAGENLCRLQKQLREGSYRPQAIRRVYIDKLGSLEKRPLGIPTVRDRVVQAAIVNVLQPIFEQGFAPTSYGFRPGMGAQQALDRIDVLLKAGNTWVVDADFRGYFDAIPHGPLLERVKEKVADGSLLALIESFLKAGIMEGGQQWTPTKGAPQGAVLSPLMSNVYLDPLDHLMAARGIEMVRYADDLVLMCRSKAEAEEALEGLAAWAETNGLALHPEKTRIVDAETEAFDFLGYRYDRDRRYVRKKSLMKLRETLRSKTKRTDGRRLDVIIGDVNATLMGWFGYFKRCWPTVFSSVDGWIRRRLRSILRKRMRLKGISRHGADEQKRWPNSFFDKHGLYSLRIAHVQLANPP